MNQRLLATFVAAPLVLLLVATAVLLPLPYATYEPGSTVDVLGEEAGEEIIQVDGRQVYRGEGELRMTTVLVSVPQQRMNIFEVARAWWSSDDAVYPYDAIYDPEQTPQDSEREGQLEMVSSLDSASAVALEELGVDVPTAVVVRRVEDDAPAKGVLKSGDEVLRAGGERVSLPSELVEAVDETEPGQPLRLTVLRDGERRRVEVTPEQVDGVPRVGIQVGVTHDLPYDIEVNIDEVIGGPSAGLVFALAIYDTLTPDPLTEGRSIAGTGSVGPDGRVGAIGGIAQKIAGAREDGAQLFLVPPGNCADALAAENGEMRLVRAATVHDARLAIEAWTEDPDADLPSCEDA